MTRPRIVQIQVVLPHGSNPRVFGISSNNDQYAWNGDGWINLSPSDTALMVPWIKSGQISAFRSLRHSHFAAHACDFKTEFDERDFVNKILAAYQRLALQAVDADPTSTH